MRTRWVGIFSPTHEQHWVTSSLGQRYEELENTYFRQRLTRNPRTTNCQFQNSHSLEGGNKLVVAMPTEDDFGRKHSIDLMRLLDGISRGKTINAHFFP